MKNPRRCVISTFRSFFIREKCIFDLEASQPPSPLSKVISWKTGRRHIKCIYSSKKEFHTCKVDVGFTEEVTCSQKIISTSNINLGPLKNSLILLKNPISGCASSLIIISEMMGRPPASWRVVCVMRVSAKKAAEVCSGGADVQVDKRLTCP